jgi:hypothetical protein
MSTSLIDLRQAREPAPDHLPDLSAYLAQLVGEPFQFARVSYGDELTFHFGDLRPARSPKLKKPYGSYILGLRGSAWVLKSGVEPLIVAAGIPIPVVSAPPLTVEPLTKEALESASFIEPRSRVLSASPFQVKPADMLGLEVRMSDGSTLLTLPTPPEPDGPDDGLPSLADWELLSPRGLLSAGPGMEWSFKPISRSAGRHAQQTG